MTTKTQDVQKANSSARAKRLSECSDVISGEDLRRALGYRSKRSFYRAVAEDRMPVRLFKLPGGRAWNARTQDVAQWLNQVGGLA